MKTKTFAGNDAQKLLKFPKFHKFDSIRYKKKHYYGIDSLMVRHGNYVYVVTSEPDIYYNESK
jgi:hypothetical protein